MGREKISCFSFLQKQKVAKNSFTVGDPKQKVESISIFLGTKWNQLCPSRQKLGRHILANASANEISVLEKNPYKISYTSLCLITCACCCK
jgi:hypothetical protein